MKKSSITVRLTLTALIAAASSMGNTENQANASDIRVVACDAQIQSHKRGVCVNKMDSADFEALAPGVSWWYNWGHGYKDKVPSDVKMEYLPMVWGNRPEEISETDQYLAAGKKPRAILGLNEPNLKGQAFISPKASADAFQQIAVLGKKYGVPVVAPQMAIGSSNGDSIVATDPFTGQTTTYTFMIPFLKAFLHYAEPTDVPSLSIHTYGNLGETKWAVGTMEKEFHKPLWVTEFSHVPSPAEALTYLVQSVDFFERTPNVKGYAWFKERSSGHDSLISLLGPDSGSLTALGRAYVAMPVHEKNLYYRLPGQLDANRYVDMEDAEIYPTTDISGVTEMRAESSHASIDYNVQLKAGTDLELQIRAGGTGGPLDIFDGDKLLANTHTDSSGWDVSRVQFHLDAGLHTLKLRFGNKGQAISWLKFTKVS